MKTGDTVRVIVDLEISDICKRPQDKGDQVSGYIKDDLGVVFYACGIPLSRCTRVVNCTEEK